MNTFFIKISGSYCFDNAHSNSIESGKKGHLAILLINLLPVMELSRNGGRLS